MPFRQTRSPSVPAVLPEHCHIPFCNVTLKFYMPFKDRRIFRLVSLAIALRPVETPGLDGRFGSYRIQLCGDTKKNKRVLVVCETRFTEGL